jgi:hypothetical protein
MLQALKLSPEAHALLLAFITVTALAVPVSMWWLDRK